MGWLIWVLVAVVLIIIFNAVIKTPQPKAELQFRHMDKVSIIECENIPQGISGIMELNNKTFSFTSDNYKKEIPISHLISVSIANSDQIINGSSFSMGRAVVGGAVFGAVGGAIGGFSGNKNFTPKIVIIEYEEDGINKTMLFSQYIKPKDNINGIINKGKHLERLCITMNNEIKNR